jgi:DNA modification methylase
MYDTLFHDHDPSRSVADHYDPAANVILHHGDTEPFIDSLPDESVSLIVTSPPYNMKKSYETNATIEAYLEDQSRVIAKLRRILKPEGSICWQVGNFVRDGEVFPLDILYYNIFKYHGFFLRNRIIWHFGHGLHASRRFSGRYETILWFTKSHTYTFNLDAVRIPSKYPGKRHYKGPNRGKPSGNPKGKNPSDVWEILVENWEDGCWDIPNVKSNHPEKTIHPCQFPVEIVERCVLALTHEQDWVFDPYVGVGSSLIAALKHNRRAIGSEKEADYIRIAHERLHAYWNGTLKLRPIGKPVHTPTGREKVSRPPQEWGEDAEQPRLLEPREDHYE